MSFNISGITRLDSRINQVQTTLQMRNQNAYQKTENAFQRASNNTQGNFDTYNSQGKWNKSDFNNRLVANTMDRINQPHFNNAASAQANTYNFSKEVLGAYANFIR